MPPIQSSLANPALLPRSTTAINNQAILDCPLPPAALPLETLRRLQSQAEQTPEELLLQLSPGCLKARLQGFQTISYLCEIHEDQPVLKLKVIEDISRRYEGRALLDLSFQLISEQMPVDKSLAFLRGEVDYHCLGDGLQPQGFFKSYNQSLKLLKYSDQAEKGKFKNKASQSAQFRLFGDPVVPSVSKEPLTQALSNSQLYRQMKECFRLRPIWLRNALLSQLKDLSFTSHQFFKCIRNLSYSYRDGPWKHTHVRFGYDPQRDRDSLVFQSFTISTGVRPTDQKEVGQAQTGAQNSLIDKLYDPTMRKSALLHRAAYQYCDIDDRMVLHELRAQKSLAGQRCDRKYGFMQRKVVKKIIRHLKG